MIQNLLGQAAGTLRLSRVKILGLFASTITAAILLDQDSKWFGVALPIVLIFIALALNDSPNFKNAALEQAKAQYREKY